ncbi:hypothetical protein PGB90_003149 [Kerria lacca]
MASNSFANIMELSGTDWLNAELSTGTTIMAAEYDGGVVIGSDSRTTTGAYIANRVTDKLTRVTDYIYCCRSGSAADTQAITDIVSYHLDFQKVEMNEEPLVETAAKIFQELIYNYRSSFTASIIVAGWDRRKGGQVYCVPLGGMCVREKVSIGGSGSSYIFGFVDSNYEENMDKEKCIKFVAKAISLAIDRDGSSGGVVRIGVIDGKSTQIERRIIQEEQFKLL